MKKEKKMPELLSIAAHQLRTPLTLIIGYLDMILSGDFGKLNVRQSRAIANTLEQSKRLGVIVENFLSASQMESGMFNIEKKSVDLERLVSATVDQIRALGRKKGVRVRYNHKKGLFEIQADPMAISNVLLNLLDNAVKFSSKGEIRVNLEKKKDKIMIIIEDSGIGIDKKDLKSIFDKFFRASGAKNVGGTGLGLYISKKIIEAHGGSIEAVSSGTQKGAKFIISL